MINWGINALNHGSSLAVFKDGRLVDNYINRYSDQLESFQLVNALNWGAPDNVFWYEQPLVKKARQLRAGQWKRAFNLYDLPRLYLNTTGQWYAPITYTPHHASHAAAGYYTSPFSHAAVVVLDAIGEFECASIWEGHGNQLTKVWSKSYPNSLGLFYSAFTQLIGLEPIRDEYILQQMAATGNSKKYYKEVADYISNTLTLTRNLHKGVSDWPYEINSEQDRRDIAAAVQAVFEEQIHRIMLIARKLTGAENLVYMGGCSMNSRANLDVVKHWKGVWSLPEPGDPSSSIGAVLYHTKQRISWTGPLAKHIKISV